MPSCRLALLSEFLAMLIGYVNFHDSGRTPISPTLCYASFLGPTVPYL